MDEKERSRHRYYMEIAIAVRRRANCKGTRVGAVIVRDNRIISTGYNGTPEGVQNCNEGGCYRCNHRDEFVSGTGYDLCICVHAEQNAILTAARFGIGVEGSTMYTTSRPCFGCTKEMLQTRIVGVYYLHEWNPSERSREEYLKLQTYFSGGVHQFELPDAEEEWAIPNARQPSVPDHAVDDTGHASS